MRGHKFIECLLWTISITIVLTALALGNYWILRSFSSKSLVHVIRSKAFLFILHNTFFWWSIILWNHFITLWSYLFGLFSLWAGWHQPLLTASSFTLLLFSHASLSFQPFYLRLCEFVVCNWSWSRGRKFAVCIRFGVSQRLWLSYRLSIFDFNSMFYVLRSI